MFSAVTLLAKVCYRTGPEAELNTPSEGKRRENVDCHPYVARYDLEENVESGQHSGMPRRTVASRVCG